MYVQLHTQRSAHIILKSYDISFVTVVYRKCLSTYDSGNKDIHDMTIGVFCSKLLEWYKIARKHLGPQFANILCIALYVGIATRDINETVKPLRGWFLVVSSNFVLFNEWWIFRSAIFPQPVFEGGCVRIRIDKKEEKKLITFWFDANFECDTKI